MNFKFTVYAVKTMLGFILFFGLMYIWLNEVFFGFRLLIVRFSLYLEIFTHP